MTSSTPDGTAGRGPLGWALIVFVVAAGVRVGWVTARYAPQGRAEQLDYPDEEAYVLAARGLARGEGLVDEFGYRATYMPGYPAFLAAFQGLPRPLLWSRLVQAVLAAWVAPATWLLARQWLSVAPQIPPSYRRDGEQRANSGPAQGVIAGAARAPERAAGQATASPGAAVPVLAGLAAAVDPFLLFFSGLLLTEALFAAVLVTAWLFVLPMATRERLAARDAAGHAFASGVLLLAGVLLRPAAAVVLIAGPTAVVLVRRLDRSAWLYAAVTAGVVLSGLLPWAVRNRMLLGEWRWLSTRGGISLYDGLQPGATGGSDLAHTKSDPGVRGLGEVEWDRYFHDKAMQELRRDPARAVRLAGRKFLRTWSLTPHEAHYRTGPVAWISAAWMTLLLATAAAGWWMARRSVGAWLLLLTPAAAFTALHMVYVGSVRYRVPVMPFIMVLSAAGAWTILRMAAKITAGRS